jgi:hypothetical protein
MALATQMLAPRLDVSNGAHKGANEKEPQSRNLPYNGLRLQFPITKQVSLVLAHWPRTPARQIRWLLRIRKKLRISGGLRGVVPRCVINPRL